MLQFPAAHQQSCGRLQNLQSRRAAYITACAQLENALCCLHAVRRPAVLPAAAPPPPTHPHQHPQPQPQMHGSDQSIFMCLTAGVKGPDLTL
jgi:hypothetical protein